MAFKKGISGNPSGRPIGTKNRSDLKEAYQNIIENNLPKVETWLNDISVNNPGKALEFILKLSEFVLPKMKATEIDFPVKDKPEQMTPEQRDKAIAELKEKLFND